jgi:hypothetical protein
MSVFTQEYDIIPVELRALKRDFPLYFSGLAWPRYAVTIKVALADAQVIALVNNWSVEYRQYDQGIAYEGKPVDEKFERVANGQLNHWSEVWDAKRVRELHELVYEGFRHPTEAECQAAEARASLRNRTFGKLMD